MLKKKSKKYKHFRSICLQRTERVFLQNPRKTKSVTLLNSINATPPPPQMIAQFTNTDLLKICCRHVNCVAKPAMSGKNEATSEKT